jgi:hypothetical protein
MIAARRAKALAIRAASGAKRCMRDSPLNLSTRNTLLSSRLQTPPHHWRSVRPSLFLEPRLIRAPLDIIASNRVPSVHRCEPGCW